MERAWRNRGRNGNKFLPLVKKNREILIFDTETTGLQKDAKIIQFSAVRYTIHEDLTLEQNGYIDTYINPEEPLSDKIIEITGITDDILSSAPVEKRIGPQILKTMSKYPLWAAYNCNFDMQKLYGMAERCGIPFHCSETIDVLQMARDCIPKTEIEHHNLETVSKYLFPGVNARFHSSLEDVQMTGRCLEQFLKMYAELSQQPELKRQAYVEWASYWVNPHQPSMKRITLSLSDGDRGSIFWDVIGKTWSCKSDSKSKKLFDSLDLSNIEQQVLNRYGPRYNAWDMEELAQNWGKEKSKKAS